MEEYIDTSFDEVLSNIDDLTWLPWIGSNYKNHKRRLLIIGHSQYELGSNDEEYRNNFMSATEDKDDTRKRIYQYPISRWWRNKIYDNIHRALLGTNDFDKELFWKQVCFYNFIQRIIDYRSHIKEQPKPIEFYNSWKPFIDLIKILNPTDCIFIGVSASHGFNQAMEDLRINYSPIKELEKIGGTKARIASLKINENEINLSFIQHTSKMFSWRKWNIFLESNNKEVIENLKNIVL